VFQRTEAELERESLDEVALQVQSPQRAQQRHLRRQLEQLVAARREFLEVA
jgi:hypothetical protein